MIYRFRCPACHSEQELEQPLGGNHSGQELTCAHCSHKGLQRLYSAPATNTIPRYKEGISNPFGVKK